MIRTHILGFPRIGAQRELKQALERHWRGELDADGLEAVGRTLRARHWAAQQAAGLDFVTVGDFSFYDTVGDHIRLFGAEPARFGLRGDEPDLQRAFTLARARDGGAPALEMTKWFDTNYHYLVPEFHGATHFRLAPQRLLAEVAEAQALGHRAKPVLLGPLSFLWLGKATAGGVDRLALLDTLLPCYLALLRRLGAAGVQWVQLDEPILGLDLPADWRAAFGPAYAALQPAQMSVLLATYFSPLRENLALAAGLPVAGLHVDAVRAADELGAVLDALPADRELSVGIVDGRNVWRTDLDAALALLRPALARRGQRLWLAPSCSLLHVPYTLANDAALDAELRGWLAGAHEKLAELALLRRALAQGSAGAPKTDDAAQDGGQDGALAAALAESRAAVAARTASPRVRDPRVDARLATLPQDADRRGRPYPERRPLQQARLALPAFPTTTIGSFPQTAEIRAARAAHRRGALDAAAYDAAMAREIAHAIALQERLGLDVLVHGEAERNDMVEHFGERLAGCAITADGWVQSYGSRCVKPPVVYGDVSRPAPMTVHWARHAQRLTARPVKGMLTGPVTMLQWSFVRDDQPRERTALQLALAIRDEVADLEAAGIAVIQIDEPAFREGLPLRRDGWAAYLGWAARAFRIAASAVRDDTQVHTHMCYSQFNDILPEIAAMDADVITIETSRSAMALLRGFGEFAYPNEIGPGVYDIHSPRVPSADEMLALLRKAAAVIPAERLWVNPDCGLKTRGWPETEAALAAMVAAARRMREAMPTDAGRSRGAA